MLTGLLMPLPDSAADGDGVLLWLGPGLGLVSPGVMSVVWKKHDFSTVLKIGMSVVNQTQVLNFTILSNILPTALF
jgi:hypothetical protein